MARQQWSASVNLCLFICCWLALVVQLASGGNPDAKRLYDDLLSNYNKIVRPVVNNSDVLTVRIKLKLSQLIDLVSYHYTAHTHRTVLCLLACLFVCDVFLRLALSSIERLMAARFWQSPLIIMCTVFIEHQPTLDSRR